MKNSPPFFNYGEDGIKITKELPFAEFVCFPITVSGSIYHVIREKICLINMLKHLFILKF